MIFKPHHTAITVSDIEQSVLFYRQLGFQQVHRFDETDDSMTIVHMKLVDYHIELFQFAKTIKPASAFGYANDIDKVGVKHFAVAVDDIEAALNDLRDKGLADDTVQIEKSDTNKAWWFFIKDPDGMWVEIIKDDRY